MLEAKDTIISKEERIATGFGDLTPDERWQRALSFQAEASFKVGREDEKAKVRAIYKDANDLKELEDRIREYLASSQP